MKHLIKNIFLGIIILLLVFTRIDICANNSSEIYTSEIKSDLYFQRSNDSLLEFKLKQTKGLFAKDSIVKALEYALDIEKNIGQEKQLDVKKLKLLYEVCFLIAQIYDSINNYKESLIYNQRALNILKSTYLGVEKNTFFENVDLVKSFHNLGIAYHKLNLRDSIINLKDSAKYYYYKVIKFNDLDSRILRWKAKSLSNLSGIYEKDSSFSKAENYALKSIDIYRELNDVLGEAGALNNLGNKYLSQKRYEESKEIYNNAIDLIKNYNTTEAITMKASLYYNLAWAMRNLEQVEAYDMLEVYIDFDEKLQLDNMQRMIEQVRGEFDVNAVRNEEQAKRKLQAQQFWISIAVGVLVIISLILYILFYRQRRKTLALRLANIDYEQQQKIDALKSESRNRVLSATLDGKEEERKVIAETLHDNVSALLSSANLHLQAMGKQLNGNAPAELNKTKNILNEASDKIRDLSHSLISPVLQKFGLRLSVSEIADKFSNYELDIVSNTENLKRYESNFEVKTYNIIHEFCNNIIKHSKATRAEINIEDKEGCLLIAISDNGIGFDRDIINTKDGLGIAHIEARVELMNGDITIDSVRGLGTTVNIKLPIQKKEKVDLALSELDNF